MGKTLWETQTLSLSRNGFFPGKHHPVPAVLVNHIHTLYLQSKTRRAQSNLTNSNKLKMQFWKSSGREHMRYTMKGDWEWDWVWTIWCGMTGGLIKCGTQWALGTSPSCGYVITSFSGWFTSPGYSLYTQLRNNMLSIINPILYPYTK